MGRANHRVGAKNPLLGKVNRQMLQKAAQEIDAFARHNTRRQEVDGREPQYTRLQEIGCIEERCSDGSWRAYTVSEPMPGYGTVDVRRVERENLLPALRMGILQKLCQGGMFNDFESAKRFVCDQLDLRMVESFVGKVQA